MIKQISRKEVTTNNEYLIIENNGTWSLHTKELLGDDFENDLQVALRQLDKKAIILQIDPGTTTEDVQNYISINFGYTLKNFPNSI